MSKTKTNQIRMHHTNKFKSFQNFKWNPYASYISLTIRIVPTCLRRRLIKFTCIIQNKFKSFQNFKWNPHASYISLTIRIVPTCLRRRKIKFTCIIQISSNPCKILNEIHMHHKNYYCINHIYLLPKPNVITCTSKE